MSRASKERMDAAAGAANTLDEMLEQPTSARSRGRPRRMSKENMLTKDNMLAGTDENGCRIRIFTASLTGKRATLVCPDPDKPHLAESTYVGETIDADCEGNESETRPPTSNPCALAYRDRTLDSRLSKCLRYPESTGTATAKSLIRLAPILRDSGSTIGATASAHTPSHVVSER